MKNKNLIIGIIVLIIIVIIIIIGVIILNQKPIEVTKNMSSNELSGKWNAISEETLGEKNENLSDIGEYSIVFKDDGSYSEIIANVRTTGKYKIEGENITFYDSEEELELPGSFNKGWFEIKDNQLTLTLPKYPKIVVYRRG